MSADRPVIVLRVEEPLTPELADRIREVFEPKPDPDASWVLIKGYHDSGTIDGVYGPYTEAYIDWLLAEPLSNGYGNLTKIKLSSGPEET